MSETPGETAKKVDKNVRNTRGNGKKKLIKTSETPGETAKKIDKNVRNTRGNGKKS